MSMCALMMYERATTMSCNGPACRHGYLEVVEYLRIEVQLTIDDVRSNNNETLRWACIHGHLEVVEYLRTEFQLKIDDVRANNNEALRRACCNGHFTMIRYLHTEFQLTKEDAEACDGKKAKCLSICTPSWILRTEKRCSDQGSFFSSFPSPLPSPLSPLSFHIAPFDV
jgi:hypothetical protein